MRLTSCALLMLVAACSSSTTSPDDRRALGAIAGYNTDDPQVEIVTGPGSATVRVTTYGDECLTKGETEVILSAREAIVTPYDYNAAPPDAICTQQLVSFLHEATIDFGTGGPARILIRGADHRRRRTITVERQVVIP